MPAPLRVAVVDDDDDIRDLIALHMALDPRFELAAEARDGNSALALLERTDIDAMVLDMHMPLVSGRQVLDLARQLRPHMRVVAFSADLGILIEAEGAGAAATVAKGEPLDLLMTALLKPDAVA